MRRPNWCGSVFLAIIMGIGAANQGRGDAFLDAIDAIVALHGGTGADPATVENAAWALGFIYSDLEVIKATGYGSYALNPQFHEWMKTAMVAITGPGHTGAFTPAGIVALLDQLGIVATQGELAWRVNTLRQLIADFPEIVADLTDDEKAALDDTLDSMGAADALLPAGLDREAGNGDLEEALRQAMGGFSPFSSPVQLSRNLMAGQLLRGLGPGMGGGNSNWMPSGEGNSAWGINTWGEDWSAADEEGLSLTVLPYFQGGDECTSFSVGLPLFWTTIEDMASDDYYAFGVDGTVRHELGGGAFVGAHAALIDNYNDLLDDNEFISAVGGPFAGVAVPLSERLVATCAVISEGIYTEKADATWYVAGGVGLSALVVDNVAVHVHGLYYRNMDTYNSGDDSDFVDVGGAVEVLVGERTSVSVGLGTVLNAEDYDSIVASIGLRQSF